MTTASTTVFNYTAAINDTRNREDASPWLRDTLESALERAASPDGSPLRVAQDASRLHTMLTDWFIEVSAGRLAAPVAQPKRNHYWISVNELDAEFPDIVQARLSRDEESNVRSQLMDMQGAGEIDSYEVTEYTPDTKGHADVLEWLAGLKAITCVRCGEPCGEDNKCPECGSYSCDEHTKTCFTCDVGSLCYECKEKQHKDCDEDVDPEHPPTDEHRSGCVSCQKKYDQALPEVQA